MAAVSPKPHSPRTTINDWDEAAVHTWLVSIGVDKYEAVIHDQGITGEVLCHVDLETLTDIGVSSVGHRLKILRAVYEIKLESGIEIGEEDWRPQDDVSSAASNSRLWDLYTICQKQIQSSHEEAQRMRSEMAHLRAALGQLTQELQDRGIPVTASIPTLVEDAVAGTPTAPMAIGSLSSPVTYTADLLTPRPPLQRNGSSSAMRRSQSIHDATIAGTNRLPAVELTAPGGSSKSRLNADSLCTAVLPAALKKYKIHDDWKQYCLFICYEDRGRNIERCIAYDEQPILLIRKIKDSGRSPGFALRHIQHMRSPVVNAREKYSKKTVDATTESSPTAAGNGVAVVSGDRPSGRTPGEGRFPELPSPGIRGYDMDAAKLPSPRPNGAVDQDGNPHKVTYAASIYPYIANKPDEMDVAVNATFVVLSKSKSWWRVQRDPEGRGNVIIDESRAGWVPSGCFLELAVPPTSALKLEARNIKSSSVLGKALQDFTAGDDTELSIQEGERVRVYKRYNNWSFSLNEDTHARGWTPSWLIGKFPKDTRDGKEIGTVKEATRIQGAVSPRLLELPSGEARPT